jgi:ribonuclease J
MNEMVEIKPTAGSVYILSQSEPFNEEMELDFEKQLNWLERYGVPLYNIHSSGHALPHHLREVVRRVRPERLFLIHTERPELYRGYLADLGVPEIICPRLGQTYLIS